MALNVDVLSAEARFALPKLVSRRHDLIVARARENPRVFATHVLRDEKTGKRVKLAPMHLQWHDLIDQHKQLLLWSFVEAGKTAGITVGRSLWELGRQPNLRIAVLSKTKPLAQKIVRQCQQIIAGDSPTSYAYREVFPGIRPARDPSMPWTSLAITVERSNPVRDPSIQACGNFGNIIGSRIDLLILDDVLDSVNTRTPAPRDALWDWVHGTLIGRLTEGARIIVIGNAWHPDDLMHRFERAPGYKAFRFPVQDEKGNLAWPERWNAERVEEAKDRFGPLDFARQLFCQPRDDDSSKFKREWLDACLQRGEGLDFLATRAEVLDELSDPAVASAYRLGDSAIGAAVPIYVGVDLAVQQHASADLTAFATVALLPDGTRRLVCIESGRWGAPEILRRIADHDERYKPVFVVENVGCFPPEARVLTSDGYRPMSSVEPGTLVMTHLGRWRRVEERTERAWSGRLVEVRSCGNLAVECTPNHAFWASASGRVLGSRASPDVGKHRPAGEPGWHSACVLRGGAEGHHYVSTPVPSFGVEDPVLELEHRGTRTRVVVDEDLALTIGLYLADGHATRAQVCFTLGTYAKAACIEHVERSMAGDGKVWRLERDKTTRVIVNSTALARALAPVGKSVDKRMPWSWMRWPLDVRLAIVRGWLLGDGSLTGPGPRLGFMAGSISRDLIAQMRLTLVEAGLRPGLWGVAPHTSCIDGRPIVGKAAFALRLSPDDSARLLSTGTSRAERLRWAAYWDRRRAGHESKVPMVNDGRWLWSKVRGAEEAREYSGLVYNLVVEEDHSYVVDDLAVHNSQDYIVQLAQGRGIPVVPYTTGVKIAHPEFGIEGLAAEFAAAQWVIPNRKGEMNREVFAVIQDFLGYDPRSHKGDRMMGVFFAREGLRMLGSRPVGGTARVRVFDGGAQD